MGFSVSIINPSQIAREGLSRIMNDGGLSVASSLPSVESFDDVDGLGDLVLIDLPNPADQITSIETLSQMYSDARPVVLAEKFDYAAMVNCFEQGAQGYAVKNIPCTTLIAMLQVAALGHKVMPSDLADLLRRAGSVMPDAPAETDVRIGEANLSHREHDVLCCLMAGYPNKLIARKLEVSEATVKVHVKAILRKLNVMNRTQAAIWATSKGIGGGGEFLPS
ncbi:MAG: hypothetical protein RLZZ08_118 [Pseudomonadota bacterium]|jgi:two-component system nitrate/nitrite response regulator NarL